MREVVIDFLPESAARWRATHAIVAIDVIRATTTLATAAAAGRRCYVAPTAQAARARAARLPGALLAGEVGGDQPEGFDLNNSPAALALHGEPARPMVLVSSSGTRLIDNARGAPAVYVACFRNFAAVAAHAARRHARVAVLGAGTRGEFREEDQICCAWIAARLMAAGYAARDPVTAAIVARWRGARAQDCRVSKSVAYLERSGQLADLDFVLSRVNDLDEVLALDGDEVVALRLGAMRRASEAIRAYLAGRRAAGAALWTRTGVWLGARRAPAPPSVR